MPDQPTIFLRPNHVLCTCLKCGTQFSAHASRIRDGRGKFCSRACMWGHREERVCLRCGKAYSFRKGGTHIDNGYCSQSCKDTKERWTLAAPRGTNSDERTCAFCGKSFVQYASRTRRGVGVYCSKACHDDARRGALNPHWIDYRETAKRDRIADMNRGAYRTWRAAVYARDNWTCQDCGHHGGRLHAHHISDYAHHPELRYDLGNGVTLCPPCHYKRHSK